MQIIPTHFYSDYLKLDATFYTPDHFDESRNYAALVIASGYTGLNAFYPKMFASRLTACGFVVFGFDYRGQGASQGTAKRIILEEQMSDIRSAMQFVLCQPFIESKTLGLIGWGMGAGLALEVAITSAEVRALTVLNGFFDGRMFYRHAFTDRQFNEVLQLLKKDRIDRVKSGKITYVDCYTGYPLDPDTEEVVSKRLRSMENFSGQVSLEVVESIMRFRPLARAGELDCPIFIGHGKHNRLHPLEQSQVLHYLAPEPKQIYMIDGKHNDFMYEDSPVFEELCERLIQWFRKPREDNPSLEIS